MLSLSKARFHLTGWDDEIVKMRPEDLSWLKFHDAIWKTEELTDEGEFTFWISWFMLKCTQAGMISNQQSSD